MSDPVYDIGGTCPVEAEGTVDGLWMYFRARGERWTFEVWDVAFGPTGELPEKESIWWTGGAYDKDGEFGAGYMPLDEANAFIAGAVAKGRAENWGRP